MRPIILVLLAAIACAADVRSLPIVNGSMSQGEATCTGWDQQWTGSGKLTASRDAKVFKEGPASLCLATAGDAKGNISQRIAVPGGSTIAIAGWLRSEGLKAHVFVQSFDEAWKPIDYKLVLNQFDPAPEWVQFSGTVTVPAKTVQIALGVAVEGNGKVWIDEVRNVADAKAK